MSPRQSESQKQSVITSQFIQDEFVRLRGSDLRIIGRDDAARSAFRIDGFSRRISGKLLEMALINPNWTKRLVRDMKELTTRRERHDRIDEELNRAGPMYEALKDRIEELERAPVLTRKEQRELVQKRQEAAPLKRYLDNVLTWDRSIMDGAR